MHPVNMQKARGNETVVLFVNPHFFDAEFVSLKKIAVIESLPGNITVDQNEDDTDG